MYICVFNIFFSLLSKAKKYATINVEQIDDNIDIIILVNPTYNLLHIIGTGKINKVIKIKLTTTLFTNFKDGKLSIGINNIKRIIKSIILIIQRTTNAEIKL